MESIVAKRAYLGAVAEPQQPGGVDLVELFAREHAVGILGQRAEDLVLGQRAEDLVRRRRRRQRRRVRCALGAELQRLHRGPLGDLSRCSVLHGGRVMWLNLLGGYGGLLFRCILLFEGKLLLLYVGSQLRVSLV